MILDIGLHQPSWIGLFYAKIGPKNFSNEEIENFRNEMNRKIMFYTIDQMLNFDESGVFWNQMHGRIIVKKGKVKIEPKLHLVHYEH